MTRIELSRPGGRTRIPVTLSISEASSSGLDSQWLLGLALLVLFALVYWPVMLREEEFLRKEFGETFVRYAAAVPFFFPSLGRGKMRGEPFRWIQYRKNREYRALLGYAGGVAFLVAKMLLR